MIALSRKRVRFECIERVPLVPLKPSSETFVQPTHVKPVSKEAYETSRALAVPLQAAVEIKPIAPVMPETLADYHMLVPVNPNGVENPTLNDYAQIKSA